MRSEVDIHQAVHALRKAHPELRRAVTWHGIRRVLHRMDVDVIVRPLTVEAKVVSMGDVAVIALNSALPPRRHTYRLAHELGHIALHTGDGSEGVVFNMSACWPDDPREDEAEYFAMLLLQGPPPKRKRAMADPAQLPFDFASSCDA